MVIRVGYLGYTNETKVYQGYREGRMGRLQTKINI
jgi:hypothetical protein